MGAQHMEGGEPDGKELFRELLRLFPGASLEDYYKNGLWQVDTMQIDKELIEAHRKEAGAPEPIPLEEVQMPKIPMAFKRPPLPGATLLGGQRPAGPGLAFARPASVGSALTAGTLKPSVRPTGGLMKPVVPKLSGTAAAATVSGASSELRQIALFIQKWQLDATKSKLTLARLTPVRRKWVMANYRGVQALEAYIQQCERTNAWAAAGPGAASSVAIKPLAPGLKRLAPSTAAAEPAKRPRLAVLGAKQPSGAPPSAVVQRSAIPASSVYARMSPAAAPSWAPRGPLRPTLLKPGVMKAAPKIGAPRPGMPTAAPKLSLPKVGATKLGGARPTAWGSGAALGARPVGRIGVTRPPMPKQAARPPPKASGPHDKPGSLMRSLLR